MYYYPNFLIFLISFDVIVSNMFNHFFVQSILFVEFCNYEPILIEFLEMVRFRMG